MKKSRHLALRLLRWYRAYARDLPWRRTSDPYAIWVSEIMLQQTQVATVIPYWERWMKRFPDVDALARARERTVLKQWEGLGYYSRARNLQQAARVIRADFDGRFPRRHEDVLALPGVGRYTAGAICSIAFNQPEPLVDGNVIRVLTRLRAIAEDPKKSAGQQRLWSLARELVGEAAAFTTRTVPACSHFNQALMELGACLCTAQNPACDVCPLKPDCAACLEGRTLEFPRRAGTREAVAVRNHAFLIQHRNRWLLRQRTHEQVNRGFWEFPNVNDVRADHDATASLEQLLPGAGLRAMPCGRIRHSITHHRITIEVHRVHAKKRPSVTADGCRWISRAELESLPLAAAHRKIVRQHLPPIINDQMRIAHRGSRC